MSKYKKELIIGIVLVLLIIIGLVRYSGVTKKESFESQGVIVSRKIDDDGSPLDIINSLKSSEEEIVLSKENEEVFFSIKCIDESKKGYRVILYEGNNSENRIDNTRVYKETSGYINYSISNLGSRSNKKYKIDFYNKQNKVQIEVKIEII